MEMSKSVNDTFQNNNLENVLPFVSLFKGNLTVGEAFELMTEFFEKLDTKKQKTGIFIKTINFNFFPKLLIF